MIRQFEPHCRFVLFEFSWPNLDVEAMAAIGDFQNLWPSETIDSQSKHENTHLDAIKFKK